MTTQADASNILAKTYTYLSVVDNMWDDIMHSWATGGMGAKLRSKLSDWLKTSNSTATVWSQQHTFFFADVSVAMPLEAPACVKRVSQMRTPLTACRQPAGKLWQQCKVLYVFEHKMKSIF